MIMFRRQPYWQYLLAVAEAEEWSFVSSSVSRVRLRHETSYTWKEIIISWGELFEK